MMQRRIGRFVAGPAVAISLLALTVPAEARGFRHSYGIYVPPGCYGGFFYRPPVIYGYPYGVTSFYFGPAYYPNYLNGYNPYPYPYPYAPDYGPPAVPYSSQEVEPPAAPAQPTAREEVAEVDLAVPANTELWIRGVRMTQTGPMRRMVSPPLKPGLFYDYELRATFQDNGKEVTTVRTLRLRAGDRLHVALLSLPTASAAASTASAQR